MLAVKLTTEGCVLWGNKDNSVDVCPCELTLDEKKEKLRKLRCCFRCGKQFHRANECRSWKRLCCAIRKRRQITSMCDPRFKREKTEKHTTVSSSSSSTDSLKYTVLLETAQVWAQGAGSRPLVGMVIDGGSQRSFVTEEISRKLKATVIAEELTISEFGNISAPRRYYRRVLVILHSQYDSNALEIEATEVAEICNDLSTIKQ